ncbi:MAG: putative molybdenum carrier protein [SAR324 cluster bacterium]|nr:putative molybdenum carrier protein [SAR324 cluster bacterium]
MIHKIVSGGQTGVDRAALNVALELNIPCGGWCPRGRIAEDGRIAEHYPLQETPSRQYAQRTEWNVRDSDGTLILNQGKLSGGTLLTWKKAEVLKKQHLVIPLSSNADCAAVWNWIHAHHIQILNIAGPRENSKHSIYKAAKTLLHQLFQATL